MTHQQPSSKGESLEAILDVLPHLILGNAEELYNNPDGEMAKLTMSELRRVVLERHKKILASHSEAIRERVEKLSICKDCSGRGTIDCNLCEEHSHECGFCSGMGKHYTLDVDDILALLTDDKNI